MASQSCPSTNITTTISSTKHVSKSFFPKTSQISVSRTRNLRNISCNVSKNGDRFRSEFNESSENVANKLDRRNVLIGLGGLYGAATTLSSGPDAFATPVGTPHLSTCGPASNGLNCCPPRATNIVDFRLPAVSNTLRVRPAAHLVDEQYKQKFNRAISLMKALPATDPRNFIQQANVHCAYCNGGYNQLGFPNQDLQVHFSWLFLPFHRYYLYFFERILGSLINDPTFGIPYWNWDAPAGMPIPPIYTDRTSPLFDRLRDLNHQPPQAIDLNYDGSDDNDVTNEELISANLSVMYRQMVSNARTARLFMGQPYRAGDEFPPGAGSIENLPHGPVHVWTGDPNQPNGEDMGTFYSAARDPIFYAHHTNIDRLWFLWKSLGSNRTEFTDPDWLNASFVFFDENAQAVRVSVKDCIDTRRLGYTYQTVDLPWRNARPTPRASSSSTVRSMSSTPNVANAKGASTSKSTSKDVVVQFPRPLDKVIRTNVSRPKYSRSKKEKQQEEEVLVIDVEVEKDVYVKFDVYINDEDDDVVSKKKQIRTEFAGSFVNVPHKHNKHGKHVNKVKTALRLGLTEIIEDLGADDDDGVTITLIPRSGKGALVIDNIKIKLSRVD